VFDTPLQRNFVHQHSDLLWEEELDNVEERPQETGEPPVKRKKVSKNKIGKLAKGHDFWSMVDDWYGDKMKVLGTKITDPGWKQ
jgi:hypothetical protein